MRKLILPLLALALTGVACTSDYDTGYSDSSYSDSGYTGTTMSWSGESGCRAHLHARNAEGQAAVDRFCKLSGDLGY